MGYDLRRRASRLRAVSRALLWPGSDGSVTSQDDNQTPLTVKTDGSGYAKVYLLPGTSADTLYSNLRRDESNFSNGIGDALTGAAASSVRVQVPLMNSSRLLQFRILAILAIM